MTFKTKQKHKERQNLIEIKNIQCMGFVSISCFYSLPLLPYNMVIFKLFCIKILVWEELEKEMGNATPGVAYSCLENSIDRGAWRATVHGVANVSNR